MNNQNQKGFRQVSFSQTEIEKMKERFDMYGQKGCMNVEQFKKSMGLLGIGEAETLSQRIFSIIAVNQDFAFDEFVQFLDRITNGSHLQKAELSFNFLCRHQNGFISYDDIQIIISEISFIWHFLTSQKISTQASINLICQKLGITEKKSINFKEYLSRYDMYFNWFDYFNNQTTTSTTGLNSIYSTANETELSLSKRQHKKEQIDVDQVEQYLKLVYGQLQQIINHFKEQSQQNIELEETTRTLNHFSTDYSQHYLSTQLMKHGGDDGNRDSLSNVINYRQLASTMICQNFKSDQIGQQKETVGQFLEGTSSQLDSLCRVSNKLFGGGQDKKNSQLPDPLLLSNPQPPLTSRPTSRPLTGRSSFLDNQHKKAPKNITHPLTSRQNIVYFGHQNWNIMLNMMLGIRKSLKSHYYKFEQSVTFSVEDINCKYYNDLIYKKNEKNVKQICQTFVDYAPKVFYYIRRYFNIDQQEYLKSIGLQNLVGNLLLGNLATLSDRTSEGKSGSFIYYTEDSRIIIKSTSRDQYKKLKQMLCDYANYVRNNPHTFIMRIYGLYKMKNKKSGRSLYFIVIGNVFDQELEIDERYDIKGATYNRRVLEEGCSSNNKNVALKDVDLMTNHSRVFDMPHKTKQECYSQLTKDVSFLSAHNIIEYSLLVGIHYLDPESTQNTLLTNSNRLLFNKSCTEMYFFGIIDILEEYTAGKMVQSGFFQLFNFDVSCRNPEEYAERFRNFIYKYVFSQ